MANDNSCGPMNEPLLQQEVNTIEETPQDKGRSDPASLTYDQATALIITLENTKNVIQNYMTKLEARDVKKSAAVRRKSWWGRHCWPSKRKWLYRYITIVTVCLQFLNLLVLTLLDAWPKQNGEWPFILASSVTMIILQVLNLLFLILASGRLVKQIYRNSVNSVFLGQTYGATILLFAGIYCLTFRLQKHSWRFVNEDLNEGPTQVFLLYVKFLFYSISTATLCGSDNVLPVYWFNCLFAGFQMLLSFCYFASILGSAMCHDNTKMPASIHSPAFTQSLIKHQQQRRQQSNNNSSEPHHVKAVKGPQSHTVSIYDDVSHTNDNTNRTLSTQSNGISHLTQDAQIHNPSPCEGEINHAFPNMNSITELGKSQSRPIEVDVINTGQIQSAKLSPE